MKYYVKFLNDNNNKWSKLITANELKLENNCFLFLKYKPSYDPNIIYAKRIVNIIPMDMVENIEVVYE
jgi:hypothetical protein